MLVVRHFQNPLPGFWSISLFHNNLKNIRRRKQTKSCLKSLRQTPEKEFVEQKKADETPSCFSSSFDDWLKYTSHDVTGLESRSNFNEV